MKILAEAVWCLKQQRDCRAQSCCSPYHCPVLICWANTHTLQHNTSLQECVCVYQTQTACVLLIQPFVSPQGKRAEKPQNEGKGSKIIHLSLRKGKEWSNEWRETVTWFYYHNYYLISGPAVATHSCVVMVIVHAGCSNSSDEDTEETELEIAEKIAY